MLPYARLVERVDRARVDAVVGESRESVGGDPGIEPPVLSLDSLVDCELQTMRVAGVRALEGSGKLVVLALEPGQGGARSVVAGIGHESVNGGLGGKGLLVVPNLEPKVVHGQVSQGMLLAAEVGGTAVPIAVPGHQTGAIVE